MAFPIPKPIIRKTDFFNPEDSPYEIAGFYEEILEPGTGKLYGIRFLQEPDRALGSDGMTEFCVFEDLWLWKGVEKRVILKASRQKPVHVWSMIQIIGGKRKNPLVKLPVFPLTKT